jgi:hypothetical protein
MAIIYSYPTATPEAADLLVGTEITGAGEDAPRTRTFTIGSIVDLVTPALNLKANIASPTFTGTVTTGGDAVINGLTAGRGTGNISTNTAFGINSLQVNTGYNNTAIGTDSLKTNLGGYDNTALGVNSLANNISGYQNTALGVATLNSNTTGYANSTNGYATLYNNTIGHSNTANGFAALNRNTTGYQNTANGRDALYNNIGGTSNTANGYAALYINTTGFGNTANGAYALYNNIGGTGNTAIGYDALNSTTGYSNVVGLGNGAQVTGDFEIQLGTASNTTYVYGTVQNRSDLRDKTEVRDTVLGLDFISKLRPVDYKWDMREDYKTEMPSPLSEEATEEEKDAHKIVMDEWLESVKLDNLTHDGTHTRNRYHHGLIAQEVQDLGIDFGGFQDHKINGGQDVLSIGYDELIAPMIKAIQELKAEIELLKSK